MDDHQFMLAIYVDNKYGVLSRVTALITRRGYNIESIASGETISPDLVRITITISGEEYDKTQLMRQFRKLHNVRKVEAIDPRNSTKRELMLIKVRNHTDTVQSILAAVTVFRANVIDFNPESLSIETTGEPSKINAFIDTMRPYGIMEVCRTGIVAMDRGNQSAHE